MNREILFRGKRIDNGEWAEGSLIKVTLGGKTVYLIFGNDFTFDGTDVKALDHALVDPETVGEYTGLNANGKKIFEGDIVQAHFRTNHTVQKYEVTMADGMFLFDNRYVEVPRYDIYDLKVIGNIHDNSELLEGVEA